ncbi:MAG: linear amide C-N hydrolase [Rhodobacteraceae bacterium]|nr:linear amide C-N hydrolase [Paracoccaceae bacterium]
MNLQLLKNALLTVLLSVSLTSNAIACTVLAIKDASGNIYQGRTNEYPGMQPDELTYYPAGTLIESVTPDGQKGMSFQTKYAIFGATLKGMTPNASQDSIHEAVNDQGMSFTTNAFARNGQAEITLPPDKVLSVVDYGAWVLGNFKTTADRLRRLGAGELQDDRRGERGDREQRVRCLAAQHRSHGNVLAPVHFAVYDKMGGYRHRVCRGETQVYDNPVGVMTNDPPFPWHLEHMNNYARLTNVDKNSGQFQALEVEAPDSGGALAGLPSSNTLPDRFVKAAYYANYALEASSPEEAIQTLSHVMNNFDRPSGITIDEPSNTSGGEAVQSESATSEATFFTVMNDLSQGHFYIRTIKQINYVRFDMRELAGLEAVTTVSFQRLNSATSWDGNELLLN